jgi:hypothetical protein
MRRSCMDDFLIVQRLFNAIAVRGFSSFSP